MENFTEEEIPTEYGLGKTIGVRGVGVTRSGKTLTGGKFVQTARFWNALLLAPVTIFGCVNDFPYICIKFGTSGKIFGNKSRFFLKFMELFAAHTHQFWVYQGLMK